MDKVRLGVVGTGGMGCAHLDNIKTVSQIELVGVCDVSAESARKAGEKYNCPSHTDYKSFVRKENVDAVLIATPHYFHPPIAIHAFEQGVHVLCEKPIAVTIGEAKKMIDAHAKRPELKFAVVFQQRVYPLWKKVKKLITDGHLEKIVRISWTISDWYRTQAYYDSGSWRGTWKGEGGGVLMNQCPHQLDILQWLFGMPAKITAICRFGRYHKIEVEDDVSALLEYADGSTMTFCTTTGEYPGTNRLEISGDRGRLVVENDKITFDRTVERVSDFTKNSTVAWSCPERWTADIPVVGENPYHKGVLENFIQAILGKAELIAPGPEGINSLMLANAMLYSGYYGKTVNLPLDGKEYESLLGKLIAESNK